MVAVVTLHVLQRGERTDRLLAEVAERLHFDRLTPREDGLLPIMFTASDIRGPEAWDLVHEALEATDPQWAEIVHLGDRPER